MREECEALSGEGGLAGVHSVWDSVANNSQCIVTDLNKRDGWRRPVASEDGRTVFLQQGPRASRLVDAPGTLSPLAG